MITVLVVDDCPDALELISSELCSEEVAVLRATDGREAWLLFEDESPDVVVSDVRMPHSDGFDLLKRVREVSDVPLILLTAHAEVPAAVTAMRAGADDYLRYPDDLDQIRSAVRELAKRKGPTPGDAVDRLLVGDSEVIEVVRNRIRSLASLRSPVLITGESGSGRARVAKALHELSSPEKPLWAVAPSEPAPPDALGTVLLREIADFEMSEQRRWCTELHRIKGRNSPFDRLIITTEAEKGDPAVHPQLWKEAGRFEIEVPPLRKRVEDIEKLSWDLACEVSRDLGCDSPRISRDAVATLQRHKWPGNVSELREILEKAVAYSRGSFVSAHAIDEARRLVITQKQEGLAKRRSARHLAERQELVVMLEECGGNVAEMSRRMGMTRGAIAYRLKKHGLAV